MSRNTKIVLGVVGGLALVCVIGCALVFIALPRFTERLISTDPANAQRIAAQIAEFTPPPGYSEQMSMDFLVYKMVVLAPNSGNNDEMIYMLMGTNVAGMDQAEMERQMQQSFSQQFNTNGMTMRQVGQERVRIRDQETIMTIAESESNPPMRQAISTFEGENGLVVLMVMGNANTWNQDQLNEFLASIR